MAKIKKQPRQLNCAEQQIKEARGIQIQKWKKGEFKWTILCESNKTIYL